jgi:hypothetical protein
LKDACKLLLLVGLVAGGMVGLHMNIEYSGWVLAVGLLGVLCS